MSTDMNHPHVVLPAIAVKVVTILDVPQALFGALWEALIHLGLTINGKKPKICPSLGPLD